MSYDGRSFIVGAAPLLLQFTGIELQRTETWHAIGLVSYDFWASGNNVLICVPVS